MPARARVIATAPRRSSGPPSSGARDSGTCRLAISTTATATGRLMRNTSRHEAALISQPPRNVPTAPATPPKAGPGPDGARPVLRHEGGLEEGEAAGGQQCGADPL